MSRWLFSIFRMVIQIKSGHKQSKLYEFKSLYRRLLNSTQSLQGFKTICVCKSKAACVMCRCTCLKRPQDTCWYCSSGTIQLGFWEKVSYGAYHAAYLAIQSKGSTCLLPQHWDYKDTQTSFLKLGSRIQLGSFKYFTESAISHAQKYFWKLILLQIWWHMFIIPGKQRQKVSQELQVR